MIFSPAPAFSHSPESNYEDTWDWSDHDKMTHHHLSAAYAASYPPPPLYQPYSSDPAPTRWNPGPDETERYASHRPREPRRESHGHNGQPPWRDDQYRQPGRPSYRDDRGPHGSTRRTYDARERSPTRGPPSDRYSLGPRNDRRSSSFARPSIGQLKDQLWALPPGKGEPRFELLEGCWNCGSQSHRLRACDRPLDYQFRDACREYDAVQLQRHIWWRRWIHYREPLPLEYNNVPAKPWTQEGPRPNYDIIKQDEDMEKNFLNPMDVADSYRTPPNSDIHSIQQGSASWTTSVAADAAPRLPSRTSPPHASFHQPSTNTSLLSSLHGPLPPTPPTASPDWPSATPPLHVSPRPSPPAASSPQDAHSHTSSPHNADRSSPHPGSPVHAAGPPTPSAFASPPSLLDGKTAEDEWSDTLMMLQQGEVPQLPQPAPDSEVTVPENMNTQSIVPDPMVIEPMDVVHGTSQSLTVELMISETTISEITESELLVSELSEPMAPEVTIPETMDTESTVQESMILEPMVVELGASRMITMESRISESMISEAMEPELIISELSEPTPMVPEAMTPDPVTSEPMVLAPKPTEPVPELMKEPTLSHWQPSQVNTAEEKLSPFALYPATSKEVLFQSTASHPTLSQPVPNSSISKFNPCEAMPAQAVKPPRGFHQERPRPQTDWTLRSSAMPTARGLQMDDTPSLKYFATDRVDILNRLARPAFEDPRFEERWTTDDQKDLARKLRDDFVIKLHGGDNWSQQGFNVDTLISEGVVRSEAWAKSKKYEFIDMELLWERLNKDAETDIYDKHSFEQFFKEAPDVKKRKNLLDCYYESFNWAPYLRPLQSKTLRSYNGEMVQKETAMEVSELTEETWFIASHALTWTGGHHDAGGRYTYIQVLLGEKWWYYFRPNAATKERLEKDPQSVVLDLVSYDYDRMNKLGDFYYVPVTAGTGLLQPSWTKHFVWTPEDSFMAGKLFDLPSFARTERCLKEEHVCGETSTNANRHGWYSALLNFAVTLPSVKPDRLMLPDDDLRALHRMLLNPRAYVPEDEQRGEAQDLILSLVVEEVQRRRSSPLSEARLETTKKFRKNWSAPKGQPKPELDKLHGIRVEQLGEAIDAVEEVFEERGLKVPKVHMKPYKGRR
ncbi:hypothetical protein CALVIDRAFT_16512 [Calocera viscosa TUFC12733]|uniref:Uncharacterized protein n=1 Tax=Calocera viscosa (strain TUFC12733) TaxID=1330018 RepID=A0A167S9W6_CALVF|nr:hypothetical protein CALVIDRAFT_16512 [Calocera viscosa TUFC12733]